MAIYLHTQVAKVILFWLYHHVFWASAQKTADKPAKLRSKNTALCKFYTKIQVIFRIFLIEFHDFQ
jgi:hypothetical protein